MVMTYRRSAGRNGSGGTSFRLRTRRRTAVTPPPDSRQASVHAKVSLLAAALLGLVQLSLSVRPAAGQAGPQGDWTLVVDGHPTEWPAGLVVPPDSLQRVSRDVIDALRRTGYLFARIDSLVRSPDSAAVVYATGGPRYRIGSVQIRGVSRYAAPEIRFDMQTREGGVLDPEVLERDIDNVLARYERDGYVAAGISFEEILLGERDGQPVVDLVLTVEEGVQPPVAEIRLPGGRRTRAAYVARVGGIPRRGPLRRFDASLLRRRLIDSGNFSEVGNPTLLLDEEGRAVIVVPLLEEAPGAFDAVLGYLPPSGERAKGTVVGNVDVSLKHFLGGGRRFAFRFNRLPARATRLLIEGEDPFVGGLPLRLLGGYEGFQQDSTFTRQQWKVEGGYQVLEGMEVFLRATKEGTRPGTDSLINVPRADTWFAGVGFRVGRTDRPRTPRRGWTLGVHVERGMKVRALADIRDDPTGARTQGALRQERLFVNWRTYLPVRTRHVAVWGGEGSFLSSEAYDVSDLFRIGGARSLRGYGEEQFRGHAVGRTFAEWRYLLERDSFLFLFFDLGTHAVPPAKRTLNAVVGGSVGEGGWSLHLGYGFGLQFASEAGIFSVSLALNPDEGLGAKVHVGISLGL